MKQLPALFSLLLLAALAATAQNNVQLGIEGKVMRVPDGDTIAVLDKDNNRLYERRETWCTRI
jgi:endonuclease YncB( thermonuclease family)